MDYESTTYIAISVHPQSLFSSSPETLDIPHPLATFVGPVGSLDNVYLLSVRKPDWKDHSDEIISRLEGSAGVSRVDVQTTKQRAKREEL